MDDRLLLTEGREPGRRIKELAGDAGLVVRVTSCDTGMASVSGADGFLQKPQFPFLVYDFLLSLTRNEPIPTGEEEACD